MNKRLKKKKTETTTTPKGFDESAFVESLWEEMQEQEKKEPTLGLLHERLEGSAKLIGLTGGIAAGKSTLSEYLKAQGYAVLDADHIARDIVEPGKAAYKKIKKTFGDEFFLSNGQLNREKMSALVFNNPEKRLLLESITHPEIIKEMVQKVKALKKDQIKKPNQSKLIFIDAALLFESGIFQSMDKNVLIKLDPETQKQRLMKRDAIHESEASKRILAQMTFEEKEKIADFIIDNSGTPEEARLQLNEVIKQLGTS